MFKRDVSPAANKQLRIAVLPGCAKCYSMAGYAATTLKSDILYGVLIYRACKAREVLKASNGSARITAAELGLVVDLRAK
jgi:hypothetical protein